LIIFSQNYLDNFNSGGMGVALKKVCGCGRCRAVRHDDAIQQRGSVLIDAVGQITKLLLH
jgi:hypothetical protein